MYMYLSTYLSNILHYILSLKIKLLYFYFLRFIAMFLHQRQCLETSLAVIISGGGGGGNWYLAEAKDATKHPTVGKTFPLPVKHCRSCCLIASVVSNFVQPYYDCSLLGSSVHGML